MNKSDMDRILEIKFSDEEKREIYRRGRRPTQTVIQFWDECGILEQYLNIIENLARVGMTKKAIAKAIGVTPPILSSLIERDPRLGIAVNTGRQLLQAEMMHTFYTIIRDSAEGEDAMPPEIRGNLILEFMDKMTYKNKIDEELLINREKLKLDQSKNNLFIKHKSVEIELEKERLRQLQLGFESSEEDSKNVPQFIFNAYGCGVGKECDTDKSKYFTDSISSEEALSNSNSDDTD